LVAVEKLTPLSKFLISGIVAGAGVASSHTYHDGFVALRHAIQSPAAAVTSAGPQPSASASAALQKHKLQIRNRPLRVAVSQWPGHMPILLAAGGMRTQPGSPAAELGLDLEVSFIEDAPSKNKALQNGDVDFVWQTVDELPISLGAYKTLGIEARAVLQIDWSRGGDACISSKEVRRVEDWICAEAHAGAAEGRAGANRRGQDPSAKP